MKIECVKTPWWLDGYAIEWNPILQLYLSYVIPLGKFGIHLHRHFCNRVTFLRLLSCKPLFQDYSTLKILKIFMVFH